MDFGNELRRCETELRALQAMPGAAVLLNERLGVFLGARPIGSWEKERIMLEIKNYTGKECTEDIYTYMMTLIKGPFNGFSLEFMPNRPNVNGTDPDGKDYTTTPPSLNKPDDIYQFMHMMDVWVYPAATERALGQTHANITNGIVVINVKHSKTITATASGITLSFAFTDTS